MEKYSRPVPAAVAALLCMICLVAVPLMLTLVGLHSPVEAVEIGGGILRPGATGDDVRTLQTALNRLLHTNLTVDGIYGPKTAAAVRQFQEKYRLKIDGIMGPQSWQALRDAVAAVPADQNTRSHVVIRGDTIYSIARRYGIRPAEIVAANGIQDPDVISPGQRLIIPGSGTAAGSPAPNPVAGGRDRAPAVGVPIALTFNDGPDLDVTEKILDLLARHGVRATFFFSGQKASQHPDLVRRAAGDGHAIENYGWSRQRQGAISAPVMALQILRAQGVLYELSGQEPKFFRPPFAEIDGRTMQAARRAGLGVVLWTNVGAEDRPGVEAGDLVRWLRDAAYPGAIIMLHAGNDQALLALEELIPIWKEKGVEFLTLDALLSRGAVWPSFSENDRVPYSALIKSS